MGGGHLSPRTDSASTPVSRDKASSLESLLPGRKKKMLFLFISMSEINGWPLRCKTQLSQSIAQQAG